MNIPYLRRALIIAAALGLFAGPASTQTLGQGEDFSATVVDTNSGSLGRIEISVNRWSTSAEQSNVLNTLFQKGSDELLRMLQDARPVGRIYTPGSTGYELHYAQQRRLPDGAREIILATDRPMSFWELFNRPRSADYPFTWVQLKIRADGTGQGQIAVAARISGDEGERSVEVEDFALQPVRLEDVQATKHRDN